MHLAKNYVKHDAETAHDDVFRFPDDMLELRKFVYRLLPPTILCLVRINWRNHLSG
jgi:hypothetical protein